MFLITRIAQNTPNICFVRILRQTVFQLNCICDNTCFCDVIEFQTTGIRTIIETNTEKSTQGKTEYRQFVRQDEEKWHVLNRFEIEINNS
uniref:DUF1326 domain-containing protein n=1 Tax=Caenorhabditis tropicalis TaxID=1561998 RepID=A0A1I7UMW3_9PELO